MARPPRDAGVPLLTRHMAWRILFVSLLMVTATFGLFLWERALGAEIEVARTVAVNTLVVAEAFYLLNSRYLTAPVLNVEGLTGNRWVPIAIVLVLFFQLLFTYLPLMQTFFHTATIGAEAWLRIFAAGGAVFAAVELEKWAVRRRSPGKRAGSGGQ
jgi:magnesium-transporting ATPase (P-type)